MDNTQGNMRNTSIEMNFVEQWLIIKITQYQRLNELILNLSEDGNNLRMRKIFKFLKKEEQQQQKKAK